MKCSFCGGVVSWVGNLIDNPSTKCADCGRTNCQEVEPLPDEEEATEWEHPCPFRGEPTKTPAGESCSACGMRESHINDTAVGMAEVPDAQR
jgi:hypothetical protein